MAKKQLDIEDAIDQKTGEVATETDPNFNKMIERRRIRANGTLEIIYDYSNCVTMTEQHTGHTTDLNYLMKKYKADELAMYIATRNQNRQPIMDADFTEMPDRQGLHDIAYKLKRQYEQLPDNLKSHFRSYVDFAKFMDVPGNADKLVEAGLLTKKQVKDIQIPNPPTSGGSTGGDVPPPQSGDQTKK